MSLDYSYKHVKNATEVMFEPDPKRNNDLYMKVRSSALIHAFMVVQLTSITEANVDEFWRRLNLWQRNVDPFMSDYHGRVYFTRDDVVAHIGLSTNVFPAFSAKKWDKYFAEVLMRKAEAKARIEPVRKLRPLPDQWDAATAFLAKLCTDGDAATLISQALSDDGVIMLAARAADDGDEDGSSGQDRESYRDDQDRESYTVDR